MDKKIGVLGASFNYGQPKEGVNKGYDFLMKEGLLEALNTFSASVEDFGQIKPTDPKLSAEDQTKEYTRLYTKACEVIESSDLSIFIGGDHSVAISTVKASLTKHENPLVIWIDAHADINTKAASKSKALHGMPLSYLLGENPNSPFEWHERHVRPEDIIYVGIRDLDAYETEFIKTKSIKSISVEQANAESFKNSINEILKALDPTNTRPMHISFDVDSIDEKEIHSTGLRVPGGLSWTNTVEGLKNLLSTRNVVSMDVVELNPDEATPAQAQQDANQVISIFS